MFDARGVGDGMACLWSRDSEVANEISERGAHPRGGSRSCSLDASVEVHYEPKRLEILAR